MYEMNCALQYTGTQVHENLTDLQGQKGLELAVLKNFKADTSE